MSEVNYLLSQIENGDLQAAEQLLPLVYDELRMLAAAKLANEQPGQTLQATALVHEAYIRLVSPGGESQRSEIGAEKEVDGQKLEAGNSSLDSRSPTPNSWHSRGHFFAAAATAMRRILIENARRKGRIKHGGQLARIELADLPQPTEDERLLALDEALTRLAAEDSQAAQVVELHHFAGLSHEFVADTLGISVNQARQKWTFARAWLQNELAAN